MGIKVNLLCIAGAAVGIVSLLLPLIEHGNLSQSPQEDYILGDILRHAELYDTEFVLAVTFFLVGIGLSFLTPAAGFVQLSGLLAMLYLYPEAYRHVQGDEHLGLGAYLGIISTVIVLVGFFIPTGIGYPKRAKFWHQPFGPACRFLTFCPYEAHAKLRVNLLCVFGALLAFFAVALPWLTTETTWFIRDRTYGTDFPIYAYMGGESFEWAAWIFLIGSAAAFVTPTASLLQFIGLYWMYVVFSPDLGTYQIRTFVEEVSLGWGFYLAIACVAIVAVSFFLPVGIGYFGRKGSPQSHLMVWGRPGEFRGIPAASLTRPKKNQSFK